MLSLIIALSAGLLISLAVALGLDSGGWGIFAGTIGFVLTSFILNRIFGKRLKQLVERVQTTLTASKDEAMRYVTRFQNKPMSSTKMMQDKIERIMEDGVRQALAILDEAPPLYKWNLLAKKQIDTLRFQLYYQVRDFKKADELMNNIFLMDPMTMAMKMARQYALEAPGLDKTYEKGAKKFKYEKGIIIYALYSWILLKRKEYGKALEVLDQGRAKTENEVLQRNWQQVANAKYNAFSNAGLGDEWYALHLEKPPKQRASKGQMKGNPMMPKGKRRYF